MQKTLVAFAVSMLMPMASNAQEPASSLNEVNTRIINGSVAGKSDWPFMTALIKKASINAYSGQFCGGSFIGGRYVLTAAHCVDDKDASEIDVSIGIHDLNNEATEGQRVSVRAIYIHQDYNKAITSNDFAILELENDVVATQATLASEAEVNRLSVGQSLTVMGWGNQTNGGNAYPTQLHQVDLPYVDRGTCQNLGGPYATVGTYAICAGYAAGGKDSCDGDSGGPLVVNDGGTYKQVGVVSWGNECALANAYGVYANVGYFKNNGWINKKTANVSYTQDIRLSSKSGEYFYNLPIRNYGAEAFDVTNITTPSGVTVVSNNCTSTLNNGDSCSIDIKVDASTVYASSNRATMTVATDHSVAGELDMHIIYNYNAPYSITQSLTTSSNGSSGGSSSYGLILLALFGFVSRMKERKNV
ncbi:S1 family peptidase [Vibrio neptunius]|uniref:S1 family peptidase n=1 Tax=Vibrio neptunius TaxID=170651 RepID=UPI0019CFB38F|nr:serine protease [Vibrio neptunius]MBN3573519.1 serine protease [Vibrio neptunius]